MAIRFVDVGSEKGAAARPAPVRSARAPDAAPAPHPAQDAMPTGTGAPAGDIPVDEAPLPGLTHAKPEPKTRGRKKPLSSAGSEKPDAAETPAAPLLDGLLPELQAHAKPTPKPRGRKKAFG